MRLAMMVALLCLMVVAGQVLGDARDRGSGDTARNARSDVRGDKPDGRHRPRHRERPILVPRPDPAVEHFWSDRCVKQRRYGMTHSKDCDNPAYTGGGYGPYADPYPRYTPYGRYGYGPYRPPGGGIQVDRGRIRGSKDYRGWDEGRGRIGPSIPR